LSRSSGDGFPSATFLSGTQTRTDPSSPASAPSKLPAMYAKYCEYSPNPSSDRPTNALASPWTGTTFS
jgi:hypothetical protein